MNTNLDIAKGLAGTRPSATTDELPSRTRLTLDVPTTDTLSAGRSPEQGEWSAARRDRLQTRLGDPSKSDLGQRRRPAAKATTVDRQSHAWRSLSAEDRFAASVVTGPVPEHAPDLGNCLDWTGGTTASGYGSFSVNGKPTLVHRYAYVAAIGPIPADFEVSHLCHRSICVAAAGGHLIAEPQAQNIARSVRLNRLRGPSETCRRDHADWHVLPNGTRRCKTCERAATRIRRGWAGADPFGPATWVRTVAA